MLKKKFPGSQDQAARRYSLCLKHTVVKLKLLRSSFLERGVRGPESFVSFLRISCCLVAFLEPASFPHGLGTFPFPGPRGTCRQVSLGFFVCALPLVCQPCPLSLLLCGARFRMLQSWAPGCEKGGIRVFISLALLTFWSLKCLQQIVELFFSSFRICFILFGSRKFYPL